MKKAEQFMREYFEFREIRPEEAEQAVNIERVCFPPNEACAEAVMKDRVVRMPDTFLVAVDKENGEIAGFLNGCATDESVFCDDFFTDVTLHNPRGKNVMLFGLDVLPKYQHRGLAHAIMAEYLRKEQGRGRELVILTCLESKVGFYEGMGFRDCGLADSAWGGEQWHEMCCVLHS